MTEFLTIMIGFLCVLGIISTVCLYSIARTVYAALEHDRLTLIQQKEWHNDTMDYYHTERNEAQERLPAMSPENIQKYENIEEIFDENRKKNRKSSTRKRKIK